jgi:NAD(P)-dependent dehydrogenase (short-subunit alcohol dehydrogenase family)
MEGTAMMGTAMEFDGLVAIVTGGASGIGAATARVLRDRGARVVVFDRTASSDAGMRGIQCDITDDAAVVGAVADVMAQEGRIDILINNAGIGASGAVEDNPDDEWLQVFNVNVLGMVRLTRAALPHLKNSPSAAIVNTSSVVADTGLVQRAVYSASKGAVASLTRAMAADLVKDGVRVNAVAPGTADTPWVGRLLDAADDPEAARAALVARQPIGRLVSADEIAHGIAYLASPLAASTTGTVLPIDGGLHSIRVF